MSIAISASRNSKTTLAIVGRKIITKDQFVKLYKEKLVRFGLTDTEEARSGYLKNLVDDEILIRQAKKEKLDRTAEGRKEKERIEVQELLNAYSMRHISPTINVTEQDLKDLFIRMNTKVKVRHLYAQTKEEADSLYTALQQGSTFSELAQKVFKDPALRTTGGSLGYISIDEMDPTFENTAYSMRIGDVSRPVKTTHGYSIIGVDDIQNNPFVTENEFRKSVDKLRRFIRKRKYEEAATQLTDRLSFKLDVQCSEKGVTQLYSLLQNRNFHAMIENSSIAISKSDLRKVVVYSKAGNWSIAKVIDALSKTSERQRKWIKTKENFTDYLKGLYLRNYIVQQAKQEGLDRNSLYWETVDYLFDTYLLTTIEERLKKQIQISPDTVRSFYSYHKENFRTIPEIRLSAILVDRQSLSDSIDQYLKSEKPFDSLAREYSIQKNTAIRGGDLGFLQQTELGEFGKKIFSLEIGKWEGPFIEEGKYLFVKCTDRKDAKYKSFEESSGEIEEMLVQERWFSVRSEYVEYLRKVVSPQIYAEKLREISIN
jgi:parvulin-like peptidyl-prolyl isomerase